MYPEWENTRRVGKKINDNQIPYKWLYFIINQQCITLLVVGKIVVLFIRCGLLDAMKYGSFYKEYQTINSIPS